MTPRGIYILGGGLLGALTLGYLLWPKGKRVALIGDSYAVGLTGPLGALAKTSGVPFQGQGVISTTPSQWASGAAACAPCGNWVAGFGATTTIVSLGINDLGYSPRPPVAPYQKIARSFPGVVWLLPPIMPNDKLAGVRSVVASLGVATIPAMTTGLSFASDGIHLTDYRPLASFIWGNLRAFGALT